jgi:HAD superfamily hydrolase (TIGR01509 family)
VSLFAAGATRLAGVIGVLLDMDGTLVDSDAAVERSWIRWSAEHGLAPEPVLAAAHGYPAGDTVRRLLPHLDPPAVASAARRQLELECDDLADIAPAAGAAALLAKLAALRLPWAVVTSADTRLATVRLAAAGIDPPVLVTTDDVAAGKPDPAGYLLAAGRLGVDPAGCLVVEDSEPGLAAGRAAGARTAALRGLPGDVAIDDLAHLARLLDPGR